MADARHGAKQSADSRVAAPAVQQFTDHRQPLLTLRQDLSFTCFKRVFTYCLLFVLLFLFFTYVLLICLLV